MRSDKEEDRGRCHRVAPEEKVGGERIESTGDSVLSPRKDLIYRSELPLIALFLLIGGGG